MQVVLHSHWFHLFVIILVLLDSLIVLFELLIDVGAFGEYLIKLVYTVVNCSLVSYIL